MLDAVGLLSLHRLGDLPPRRLAVVGMEALVEHLGGAIEVLALDGEYLEQLVRPEQPAGGDVEVPVAQLGDALGIGQPAPVLAQGRVGAPALGDVAANADGAAAARPVLGRQHPPPAGEELLVGAAALAVLRAPHRQPTVAVVEGDDHLAALDHSLEQIVKPGAGHQQVADVGVELAVTAVAQHQPLVGVEQDKPVRNALDGVDELRVGLGGALLGLLAFGDFPRHLHIGGAQLAGPFVDAQLELVARLAQGLGVAPEDLDGARHVGDFVIAVGGRNRHVGAAAAELAHHANHAAQRPRQADPRVSRGEQQQRQRSQGDDPDMPRIHRVDRGR